MSNSNTNSKKGYFGCLAVILVFIGCIYLIFKGPTNEDQEWGRKVKAGVPSNWVQISELNSSVTINNPFTWGDKGIGQIRFLISAENVNSQGDWLVQTAYVRRKPYEYDTNVKTDLGYVSKSSSIINFDKEQAIYFLEELPKYKNVDKFTRRQALNIIREEKFDDAYKDGARKIKKAIESR